MPPSGQSGYSALSNNAAHQSMMVNNRVMQARRQQQPQMSQQQQYNMYCRLQQQKLMQQQSNVLQQQSIQQQQPISQQQPQQQNVLEQVPPQQHGLVQQPQQTMQQQQVNLLQQSQQQLHQSQSKQQQQQLSNLLQTNVLQQQQAYLQQPQLKSQQHNAQALHPQQLLGQYNGQQQQELLQQANQQPLGLQQLQQQAGGMNQQQYLHEQQKQQQLPVDHQEIVWSKLQVLKDEYLPDITYLFETLVTRSQQPTPPYQLQQTNYSKGLLSRIIRYLSASRTNLPKDFKQDKLEAMEKQILCIMERYRPRKQQQQGKEQQQQIHDRLLKIVGSMSSNALSSAVREMKSVISLSDMLAASAPGPGCRAAVGEDLAASTKCRLQATGLVSREGGAMKKFNERYLDSIALSVISSDGSVANSLHKPISNLL